MAASLLLVVLTTAVNLTPWDRPDLQSIRAGCPRLTSVMKTGYRRAPTFRALVHQLDRPDAVIFVASGQCEAKAAACLRWLGVDATALYFRITVETFGREDTNVIALIAHELQHVVEVMESGGAISQAGFEAVFRNRGWSHGAGYETARARQVGRAVERELRQTRMRREGT